jgi:hypothetical protein
LDDILRPRITGKNVQKRAGSLLTLPFKNHFPLSGLSSTRPIPLSAVNEIGTPFKEKMMKEGKLTAKIQKIGKALASLVKA